MHKRQGPGAHWAVEIRPGVYIAGAANTGLVTAVYDGPFQVFQTMAQAEIVAEAVKGRVVEVECRPVSGVVLDSEGICREVDAMLAHGQPCSACGHGSSRRVPTSLWVCTNCGRSRVS